MATEKRLIDANDFHDYLEGIRQDYLEEDTLSSDFAAEVIETVQDEYLANAPTVDATEVVHGKWITIGGNRYTRVSQCTNCCAKYDFTSNYCPNCGAKMDGENSSEIPDSSNNEGGKTT